MSKSVSKNIIAKFILNAFNLIVPVLIGPYVLRQLGPSLMGSVNLSQSIFGYFFIFASFGVYKYGIREASKVRDDKEKLSKVFSELFLFTIITNVLTGIIYIWIIFNSSYKPEVITACTVLSFNLLSNIFYTEWMNEGLENYAFITKKTIIIRIIYVASLFLFVRGVEDFETYLILLVLSTFLNNIVSFIHIKKFVKFNFRFKELALLPHLKPMFFVVIISNANVLYTQLDRIMIGNHFQEKTEMVAYYATSQNIANIVNSLMLSLILATIPRLNNYLSNDDDTKYIELINKISNIYLLFLFPAGVGMFMLAEEAILLYGGQEFAQAIPVFQIFALYIITLGIDSILSNQVMYIKGKEKRQIQIFFIGGMINLILNIVFLKIGKFTPTTAIITTSIANVVVITLEYLYIKFKLNLNFNIFSKERLRYMVVATIIIPVTILIKSIFSSIYLVVILSAGISGIVYFGILYLCKDEMVFYIKEKMFEKLKIGVKK